MCNVLCHTGMFYYTLGNFRPQLRSTQQAVQLIACVSCSNLEKYGFGPVLEPFIQDANTLYEVCGYLFTYHKLDHIEKEFLTTTIGSTGVSIHWTGLLD